MTYNVLLTYGWVRSSYAVLRNLSSHGINVYVSDESYIGMSQFSKFSCGFVKYHSFYKNEKKFIEDIIKICNEKSINLIFPIHNETHIFSKNKQKFQNLSHDFFPIYEKAKIFENKSKAYDLVKKFGVSIPERIKYKSIKELEIKISKTQINKFVVKLLKGNSSKGVFVENSKKSVIRRVINLIKNYELPISRYPQIEEFVSGEGWGNSVLYWKGKKIASFSHKRLREKISFGGTSTYRSSEKNSKIEIASDIIFSKIKWHGLAMSEFKVCSKTGKIWFIEINPRVWGSISLAINSGVEFPYLAYLCAQGKIKEALRYSKTSKIISQHKSKWLFGEFFLLVKFLFQLKIVRVLVIIRDKADSYDDFYKDDKLIFIGQILRYIRNSIIKLSLNPSEKGMFK